MQKIYFGSVEIQHSLTGEKHTVNNIIFIESDTPPANRLRKYILKKFEAKEQDKYKIVRFCTESAKEIGLTTYD